MNVNYELKTHSATSRGAGRVWLMGDGGKSTLKRRREMQIPPDEALRMGERLLRATERAGLKQAHLARQIGCSGAMFNKMVKHGKGSLAGWRRACKIVHASMDYVVMLEDEVGSAGLSHLLAANRAMAAQIATMELEIQRLRRERDELVAKAMRGRHEK